MGENSDSTISALAEVDAETAESDLLTLRSRHPKLVIQMVSMAHIPSTWALRMIAAQTLRARKMKCLLAAKPEVDLLLRVAGTSQISEAMEKSGYKAKGKRLLIATGGEAEMKALRKALSKMPAYSAREEETGKPDKEGMQAVERAALLGTRT